jgi:phosphoribosylformylglycinamidine synthase
LPDGLPAIDVQAVLAAQATVREAVRSGAASSAHDIAEGGLAVALAECCLGGGLGARLNLLAGIERLFGECSGGFVVSGEEKALLTLSPHTSVELIGTVQGESLILGEIDISLSELRHAHCALAELFA